MQARSSHQSIMKCPWQWRQPFLDEKLESRKRKVGDGYYYDPVDPSFVDHLLPGRVKKFCAPSDADAAVEREQIQREIQRLMAKQADAEDEAAVMNSVMFAAPEEHVDGHSLVDSILQSVDQDALLQSPPSFAASPSSGEEGDDEDGHDTHSAASTPIDDEHELKHFQGLPERSVDLSPSITLDLVSDDLQDDYSTSQDADIVNFSTSAEASEESAEMDELNV